MAADLVPIAFAPDDFVYFMSPDAVVWGQHLVTMDRAMPVNDDGDSLISSQVLWDVLSGREWTEKFDDFVGEQLAARLGLGPLPGMHGMRERRWGDDCTLLNEAVVYGDSEDGQATTHVGTSRREVVLGLDAAR